MSTSIISLTINYLNHIVSLVHSEIGRKIDKCVPVIGVKNLLKCNFSIRICMRILFKNARNQSRGEPAFY